MLIDILSYCTFDIVVYKLCTKRVMQIDVNYFGLRETTALGFKR